MDELKSYFQDKRNLVSLLSLLILTLALPLAIFLVRNQQIYSSRAAGGPPIKFSGANVVTRAGKLVALNPQVVVELSAPYPPRVLSAQETIKTANQSIVPKLSLVSQVKAQEYLGCLEDPSICINRGQICDWYNSSSDADGCISAGGGEYLGCYDGSYTCPSGTTCDWFNLNSDANGCIPSSGGGGGGGSQCSGTSCYTDQSCDQGSADSACGAYYQDGSYCDPNNRGPRGDGCIGPGGGGTGGEPNSCEGYFQNCWEPVNPADPETQYLEGTQWCEGGKTIESGVCGYDAQLTRRCVLEPGSNIEGCKINTTPTGGQCPAKATACWIGASCSGSNQTLANETCGRTHPEFPGSICTPTEGNPDTYLDGCTTRVGGDSTPPPGVGQTTPLGGIPSVTEIIIPKSGYGGGAEPDKPYLAGESKTVKVVAPNSGHIDVYILPYFGLSSFFTMNPDTSNRQFNPFAGCGPGGNVNCTQAQCSVAEPGYLEDQCWLMAAFGGLIRSQGGSPERYDKSVCKPVTCGNNKPGDEWWDPPAWTDADEAAWRKYLVSLAKMQKIYSGPADKFTSWKVPTVGHNLGDLPGGEWFMLVNAHIAPNAADNWGPNDTGCAWNRKIYRTQPGAKFGELEINTYINDANGRPDGACVNVSSDQNDNNMPVKSFWIGHKVGDQTAVPNSGSLSGGTPITQPRSASPIPSGIRPTNPPGTTPTQPPTGVLTTISYKIAENPTDLDRAADQPYTEPLRINHTFTDTSPGQKFIWVEFTLSDNTKPRFNASINLIAPDPQILGCSLDIKKDSVTLEIRGRNFGENPGTLKSGNSSLRVEKWKDKEIETNLPNPPVGEGLSFVLERADGQKIDGECSSISQIFFSGNLFCPQVSKTQEFKGELVVKEATVGAAPRKEKITLKGGIIKDLETRLEEGITYQIGLKVEKGLRKLFGLTAQKGTTNIRGVILPLGDICPAAAADGKINSIDKACLNQQWGPVKGTKNCDLNGDGVCNSFEWACMRQFFTPPDNEDEPEP